MPNSLVELTGPDDPLNPQSSMPQWRKWLSAVLLGAMTFAATFSSAVLATVSEALMKDLDATREEVAMVTSVFVFGFAAGPIVLGPASEVYGRKIPLFLGYFLFLLSQIPVARATSIRSMLIWRFVGGVGSSGSPSIVGGYLADFLRPVERGVAVAIFAATTLAGPSVGAIVGSVLLGSPLGWRWAAWLSLIMGVAFAAVAWLVVPETYVPVLLQRKARRLRLETGNWAFHAKIDESDMSVREFVVRYLTRPFVMLVQEPILVLMTLYASFTFGMMYFLFVVSHPSFGLTCLAMSVSSAHHDRYRPTPSAFAPNEASRRSCQRFHSSRWSSAFSSDPYTSLDTHLSPTWPSCETVVAEFTPKIAYHPCWSAPSSSPWAFCGLPRHLPLSSHRGLKLSRAWP